MTHTYRWCIRCFTATKRNPGSKCPHCAHPESLAWEDIHRTSAMGGLVYPAVPRAKVVYRPFVPEHVDDFLSGKKDLSEIIGESVGMVPTGEWLSPDHKLGTEFWTHPVMNGPFAALLLHETLSMVLKLRPRKIRETLDKLIASANCANDPRLAFILGAKLAVCYLLHHNKDLEAILDTYSVELPADDSRFHALN